MQANLDMIKAGRGNVPANLDDYYKQLSELKAEGDLSGQAEVLAALAAGLADRCQWQSALSCYRESLELFACVGEIYNQGQILFNMALVYKDRGDLAGAGTLFGEALQIFQGLDAAPCIAQARLQLGVMLGQEGRAGEADEHFDYAIRLQEDLGALPDLCEAYLARAQFAVREGRMAQAEFYLSRAETLISRTDYQPLNILLCSVKGELHQKAGCYREAESCFAMALSQARLIDNLYEEARAIANLGRLALQIRDYPRALVKLQKALAAMIRLGANYDVLTLYRDLTGLYLAQEDYARAEEMASRAQRQRMMLDHPDICNSVLLSSPDCQAASREEVPVRQEAGNVIDLCRNA
jgi:tetratricopeptide (TPR) repeat protein